MFSFVFIAIQWIVKAHIKRFLPRMRSFVSLTRWYDTWLKHLLQLQHLHVDVITVLRLCSRLLKLGNTLQHFLQCLWVNGLTPVCVPLCFLRCDGLLKRTHYNTRMCMTFFQCAFVHVACKPIITAVVCEVYCTKHSHITSNRQCTDNSWPNNDEWNCCSSN